jgi:hypothetical protein
MRRSIVRFVACVAVSMVSLAVARADMTTWDAYSGFSSSANNSSQTWQYMKATTGANNDYELLPLFATVDVGFGAWRSAVADPDNTFLPYIGLNNGEIQLHPGDLTAGAPYTSGKAAAVIGWKSPVAGLVLASFSLADRNPAQGSDGVSYALFEQGNAVALTSGTINNGGASGTIDVSNIPVSLGQMLYLEIGPRTSINADWTGVTFSVTTIPEPSAFVLLSLGAVSLLAYAWRKRK